MTHSPSAPIHSPSKIGGRVGASGWASKVAYQPDIAAALQQARLEAYENGSFYRDAPDPRSCLKGGFIATC